ncbi:dihydrodipicolinate synthase family protein [Halobacterium litoreum]|uniref:Dihydrodipicolinate synthase family protein n=1 Tax=Halobacterium litoreum TaxID=2039234 RepID=A0ABD5NE61_9EURY|nr:dihydrodipicolinate synthase family protein [Halobacterium litoreum]UHH13640.1 dihydrodipicolinate synthase family protein [Halobacterium litoreum]
MNGLGVPLATPFDDAGDVDHGALADLTAWVTDRGVDFLVPCGSNSEAELLTAEERAAVVETVADAAPDGVPVLAGTGSPGLRETLDATERAADAGADAALVVTPFYYDHDDADVEAYYREVADASPLPVYLYSVPKYTGHALAPSTVAALADHPNVAGMKDSTGDLGGFQRLRERTADADFDLLVGSGSVFAPALDAGADGGVLALANAAPERASEIWDAHAAGDDERARAVNRDLVELNHAVTAGHGVPGLKAAMRSRGAPAGAVRSPHRPVPEAVAADLAALVEDTI